MSRPTRSPQTPGVNWALFGARWCRYTLTTRRSVRRLGPNRWLWIVRRAPSRPNSKGEILFRGECRTRDAAMAEADMRGVTLV